MVPDRIVAMAGALLALGLAVALMSWPARAQDPWQMPNGPGCIEQWISHVRTTLNNHNGDADFNRRKPWGINQYGLFVAQGIASAFEPDNWAAVGANKYHWMWTTYTSEERWPDWNNANFNAARLQGLRWFVRQCVGSPDSAGGPAHSAIGGISPATPLDTAATCPGSFGTHNGSTLTVICYCAPDSFNGRVWGTGLYTSDSALCRSALHAGAVGTTGGMIVAKGAPGQQAYQGTASNGVISSDYGAYSWSVMFPGVTPAISTMVSRQAVACQANMVDLRGTSASRTCHCAAGSMTGSVWGTYIYTDDSRICAAALHAGTVGPEGGTVTAVASPGRARYEGSERNGITSRSYGQWHGSYHFQ